ncbi:hypothetical protein GCM10022249_13080 [Enteractinococcus coprophilus]
MKYVRISSNYGAMAWLKLNHEINSRTEVRLPSEGLNNLLHCCLAYTGTEV